jgi:HD-GYP domain-containing protein (c-di-GMP phosphodiesterase class II)
MKLVKVSTLVPGMIIAKDVFQDTGVLMLNRGTALTAELITKLKYWRISEVMVEDLQPDFKEQQEAILAPKISIAHDRVVGITQNLMTSDNFKEADSFILQGMVGDIESQLDLSSNLLLSLNHLKTYDLYLFSHVVNVCILALIIGRELRMSPEELKELGMAALLHDFGMIKIDRTIYDQGNKLTAEQWQEIRKHPDYACAMLSESDFSPEVLEGIRQHHERINGSGYPLGLKGPEIGQYGKIIAVADVYDACISPRKHRKRFTPYEALKILLGDSHLFELKILKAFVASMAIYPIGSFIRLNTGEVAKVVGVNHAAPFRPEIRIFFDSSAQKLDEPVRINLTADEYTQTYVQETLEREETEKILQLLGE